MDAVDLAILRHMMSPNVALFGCINPRLSAESLAREVGIDPSTVRARLKKWDQDGFMTGWSVVPNPRLFGAALYATGLFVPKPQDRAQALDDLKHADGALQALDHVGGWCGASIVVDHPTALPRQTAQLRRIHGVAEVEPLFDVVTAPPKTAPTPLDWRIVKATRAAPKATLTDLAAAVGVSVNTLHTRYQRLVQADALWSFPQLDFTKYKGGAVVRAVVTVEARPGVNTLREALAARFSEPLRLQTPTALANDEAATHDLLLHLDAAAQAEEVEAVALATPGVRSVELLWPLRHTVFDAWADEQLAKVMDQQAA